MPMHHITTGFSNNQWKNVFKMSKIWWSTIGISTNFWTIDDTNESWKWVQMCRAEWFVIDNVWSKEYLKYSWLNLSWDFVIEMNIYSKYKSLRHKIFISILRL